MEDEKLNKGFIKIPNEMIEILAKAYLPNYEMRLLLAILRKTLGWNKKSDVISFTQLSKMTNIDRGNLKTASDRLSARGAITISKLNNKNVYSINENFKNWKFNKKRVGVMSRNNTNSVVSRNNKLLSPHTTKVLSPDTHTKDKIKTPNQKTNSNSVASPIAKTSDYQSPHSQLQQLVAVYVQIHKEKFGISPIIGKTSWIKWTQLFKIRRKQGFTLEKIINLLHIFAKSETSKRLSFDLGVFLSENVFNQMTRLEATKQTSTNKKLEAKYDKWK